jgi:hypothetical protein
VGGSRCERVKSIRTVHAQSNEQTEDSVDRLLISVTCFDYNQSNAMIRAILDQSAAFKRATDSIGASESRWLKCSLTKQTNKEASD